MKLTFQSNRLEKVNAKYAIDKTLKYLEYNKYNVVQVTPRSIVFDTKSGGWRSVSYFAYYSKIDQGTVIFDDVDEFLNIKLKFEISINVEILELLITIAFSIFFEVQAFFLVLLFVLNFIIKVQNIRKNLIKNMIAI